MQVLIIADDLTGALDTASPFARCGMQTRACTSVDAAMSVTDAGCDVLTVSTNSRHLPPAEAAALAASAAELAVNFKPKLVLKKIDSRLKGNVAEESAALARALGMAHLLVAPAAPDVGRFVSRGHVVGAGVDEPIAIAERFSHVDLDVRTPDVASADDLLRLAEELLISEGGLAVCSRGLAVALATILRVERAAEFRPMAPVLIGIGSRDPVTREQVKLLQSEGGFHTVEAPDGDVPGETPPAGNQIVEITGAGPQSAEVASRFAAGLCHTIQTMSPATMLLSGGDTAAAVMEHLGISEMQVCGEAAPGLPWCKVTAFGKEIRLISKSGGFGDSRTLTDLFGAGNSCG